MKKNIIFVLTIIFSLALAAACGYVAVMESTPYIGVAWAVSIYITCVLLCWVLTPILHEGGHWLFGFMAGMYVKIANVGVFSSSVCCEISPKHSKNIKGRYILTALGGLIINALFLIGGVLILCLPVFWAIKLCYVAFIPASFYLFAVNAAPFTYANGKTDGLTVAEAIQNDDSYLVMQAVLTAQGMVNEGVPLQQVDENLLLNVPQIAEDDPAFYALTQLRLQYYQAKNDEQKTAFYANRLQQLNEYL